MYIRIRNNDGVSSLLSNFQLVFLFCFAFFAGYSFVRVHMNYFSYSDMFFFLYEVVLIDNTYNNTIFRTLSFMMIFGLKTGCPKKNYSSLNGYFGKKNSYLNSYKFFFSFERGKFKIWCVIC